MADPNPNLTARDDDKQREGEGGEYFNPRCHDHTLLLFEGLSEYICSGCKEYGINKGYKCNSSSGPKCEPFTLHEYCVVLHDIIDNPFSKVGSLKFCRKAKLPHNCSACCNKLEGFLFKTKRSRSELHKTRLHPLCVTLPKTFKYSGHANHKLKIVTVLHDCKCSNCNHTIRGGWKYRCEDALCPVYLDLSCAKNDIYGLSGHDIHSTSGCKTKILGVLGNAMVSGAGIIAQAIIGGTVAECFQSQSSEEQ